MLGKMPLQIILRILLNAECVKNGAIFWWLVRAVPVLDKKEMLSMVWNMYRYTKHQRNRNRIIKS
jgi:hypothetical protein